MKSHIFRLSGRLLSFAFLAGWLTIIVVYRSVVASPTTEAPWYSQTVESAKGLFLVTLESSEPDFVLNDFRDWHIVLQDKATGEGVTPARFVVGGGMPMHGHGLPSQPQVSEHLGEGRYLIEGIRFNMLGKWVFDIEVITQSGNDKVSFEVIVDY